MTENQTFELHGRTYTVDVIGPKTTILIRDDGQFAHEATDVLRHFVDNMEKTK